MDLSSFLGIAVSATVAIGGSYWEYRRRKRNQVRRLRKAFLHEIGISHAILEANSNYDAVLRYELPTEVYESAGPRIGELTDDEVESLVDFYTWTKSLQEQINTVQAGESDGKMATFNFSSLSNKAKKTMDTITETSGIKYEGREYNIKPPDSYSETGESQGDVISSEE